MRPQRKLEAATAWKKLDWGIQDAITTFKLHKTNMELFEKQQAQFESSWQ